MPAAWVGAAAAVYGAVNADGSPSGGGGGQTTSKEPWEAARPWLQQNIATGQGLQDHYQRNPFSPMQQQAYNNQFANSDYARQLTGSVMGQMNNFRPFDRSNPRARPQSYQFPAMQRSGAANMGLGGGSYQAVGNPFADDQNPFRNGSVKAPTPAAPPPAQPTMIAPTLPWDQVWVGGDSGSGGGSN